MAEEQANHTKGGESEWIDEFIKAIQTKTKYRKYIQIYIEYIEYRIYIENINKIYKKIEKE